MAQVHFFTAVLRVRTQMNLGLWNVPRMWWGLCCRAASFCSNYSVMFSKMEHVGASPHAQPLRHSQIIRSSESLMR